MRDSDFNSQDVWAVICLCCLIVPAIVLVVGAMFLGCLKDEVMISIEGVVGVLFIGLIAGFWIGILLGAKE